MKKRNYVIIVILAVVVMVMISVTKIKQTQICISSQGDVDGYTYPFQAGDLLLFQNEGENGRAMTRAVRLFTACIINHVGMVYIHPTTKHPFVFEMMMSGVVMVPLYTKIKNTRGHVYVRSIQPPLHEKQLNLFDDFVCMHWKDPYMNNIVLHWYNRYMSVLPLPQKQTQEGFTCATLVGSTLTYIQVFLKGSDKLKMYPLDFLSNTKLPLENNFSYAQELLVHVT